MSLTPRRAERSESERSPTVVAMPSRLHLTRLFRLILTLQSERFPNARDLAERCEISRRTVYRDLELLESAGVPVLYRAEQQGYQLAKSFFLQPLNLKEEEALALLILSRQWADGDPLGLLKPAGEGALKLVQALPDVFRDRVKAKAELFQKVYPKAATTPHEDEVQKILLESLSRLSQLRVWYRELPEADELCTKFSLYRILLRDHRLVMIGRSSLKRRVDLIGIAEILRLQITDDPYVIPPRFHAERYLDGPERKVSRDEVRLRFKGIAVAEISRSPWNSCQMIEELDDGSLDVRLRVSGSDDVCRWVLGFGTAVEVLSPVALREQIRSTAESMARLHSTLDSEEKGEGG